MWRVDKTCWGWKFYNEFYFWAVSVSLLWAKSIDTICLSVIATQVLHPRTSFDKKPLAKTKFSIYIAKNVEAGINVEGGIIAENVEAGINVEGGKILKKE